MLWKGRTPHWWFWDVFLDITSSWCGRMWRASLDASTSTWGLCFVCFQRWIQQGIMKISSNLGHWTSMIFSLSFPFLLIVQGDMVLWSSLCSPFSPKILVHTTAPSARSTTHETNKHRSPSTHPPLLDAAATTTPPQHRQNYRQRHVEAHLLLAQPVPWFSWQRLCRWPLARSARLGEVQSSVCFTSPRESLLRASFIGILGLTLTDGAPVGWRPWMSGDFRCDFWILAQSVGRLVFWGQFWVLGVLFWRPHVSFFSPLSLSEGLEQTKHHRGSFIGPQGNGNWRHWRSPICTLAHPILKICSTCQSTAVYVIESHPPNMKCPHEKNPKEMVSSRKTTWFLGGF